MTAAGFSFVTDEKIGAVSYISNSARETAKVFSLGLTIYLVGKLAWCPESVFQGDDSSLNFWPDLAVTIPTR
jgi:hypothetical protein